MPRGAIPTPRSELAASEPFEPASGEESSVPSGAFPTPNHELAAAKPYHPGDTTPPNTFLAWPVEFGSWGNEDMWAEEAFAKACADPRVLISESAVSAAKSQCGASNFSAFMEAKGFHADGAVYTDGPFHSVAWTKEPILHSAIANTGPVKIGIPSLLSERTNGWTVHGLSGGDPADRCASLFGYGPLATLVDLFSRHGVTVDAPRGMPQGLCYAMFAQDSVGIIDRDSLMNIVGEAWVRVPTTVVK